MNIKPDDFIMKCHENLLSCIIGNLGSSVIGAWPLLAAEKQDISASATSILSVLFLVCPLEVPNLMKMQR